jgi:hypothetical protein
MSSLPIRKIPYCIIRLLITSDATVGNVIESERKGLYLIKSVMVARSTDSVGRSVNTDR